MKSASEACHSDHSPKRMISMMSLSLITSMSKLMIQCNLKCRQSWDWTTVTIGQSYQVCFTIVNNNDTELHCIKFSIQYGPRVFVERLYHCLLIYIHLGNNICPFGKQYLSIWTGTHLIKALRLLFLNGPFHASFSIFSSFLYR